MLNKKQISEIRGALEKSQNPIFFFDNDVDGLCSFLLLRRFFGKGRGVPIKSFPGISINYIQKINEFGSDAIFILDCPDVRKEFFDEVEKMNLPVIWIDHHLIDNLYLPKFVKYYNPKNSEVPTTYLCNQISDKREDLWIVICGCIADHYFPKFYKDFSKEYPELSIDSKDAFEILYTSEIGKVARLMNSGLKDRVTNVMIMIRNLISARGPYDILQKDSKTRIMHNRFDYIYQKHRKFLEKANEVGRLDSNLLFFQYGGEMSISSDLANELSYLFPEKIIVVVYTTGAKANISGRGKNVKKIILKSIKDFENATGGGHENAVGAMIKIEDLDKFRLNVEELTK